MSDKRVDLTYDDSGRFETITRYEDLTATDEIATTTYAYDTTGRLTSLDHAFGTTSLAGYTWTWDAADRITNYTSVLDGSVAYGYDNTGQLTSEARTNLAGTTLTTVYNYDANGNRLTAGDSAAPATYTTGANNRTLSDGTYNYEYDAEGNRTKKTEIASGDEVEYTWNHANLLTEVTYSDSLGVTTKSVSYQYDALGRRIGKSVDDNGNGTIDRSQTFIYDGAGLLAASGGSIQISGPNGQLNQHGWVDDLVLVFEDTDGAGPQSSSLSSRFLHGPAIDQIFAQESATGEVLWALTDHQGTVRDWAESADFDNDGTHETEVVKHLTFDAFGNIQSVTDGSGAAISNGTSEILHAYTGQLYDADAGLHYYRARWYDSFVGRLLSEDPLGFGAGDANVSRMVSNSTTNAVDPTGLQGGAPCGPCLRNNPHFGGNPNLPPLTSEEGNELAKIELGGALVAYTGGRIILRGWPLIYKLPKRKRTPKPEAPKPEVPKKIYRKGRSNESAHKDIRIDEDGASFRDSLSNPIPKPKDPPLPAGKPFVEVDPSKLPPGSVIPDGVPPGHVSVKATLEEIVNGISGGGKFPKIPKVPK